MNIALHAQYLHALTQLRDPQRRTWIILNPGSIADTAIMCALVDAFVKRHGDAVTMVVPPEQVPITQMFSHPSMRVVPALSDYMHYLIHQHIDLHRFEIDMPLCAAPDYLGDGRIASTKYLFKFPGRGGLSIPDMYRYLMHLPWDAPLQRPQIAQQWEQEALQLADGAGIEIGNSVVLYPWANSELPQFPDSFWETLASQLSLNGRRVFTRMLPGKLQPIAGTAAINFPLRLELPLTKLAGRIIGTVHGMHYMHLLGGDFRQMTLLMPIASDFRDLEVRGRKSSPTDYMSQFMYPELCLGRPFTEFAVPYDGSDAELGSLAVAIANESFDDPGCFKRMASHGQLFTDENADWLSKLIQPMAS